MMNKNKLLQFSFILLAVFTLNSLTTYAQSGESCDDAIELLESELQEHTFQDSQEFIYFNYNAFADSLEFLISEASNSPQAEINSLKLYQLEDCGNLELVYEKYLVDSSPLSYFLFPDLYTSGNYLLEIGRDPSLGLSNAYFQTQLVASNIYPCPTTYTQTCGDLLKNGGFEYTTRDFGIGNTWGSYYGIKDGWLCQWEAAFHDPQYINVTNPYVSLWSKAFGSNPNSEHLEGMKTSVAIQSGKTYVITCSLKVHSNNIADLPNQFNAYFVNQSVLNSYTGFPDPEIDQAAKGYSPTLIGQKVSFYDYYVDQTYLPVVGSWKVFSVCITANNNYDRLLIFPESINLSFAFHHQIDVDDVSMRELTLDAGPDYYCESAPVTIGPSCVIPGAIYTWTPSAGLSNPNIPNPTAAPTENTEYTLTMSFAGSSCTITDKVEVYNIAPTEIPDGADVNWIKLNLPYTVGQTNTLETSDNFVIVSGMELKIMGNFSVDENFAFRDCKILMEENARIDVNDGGFVIDGFAAPGTINRYIKSCDPDKFWDGIYVNKTVSNNAHILIFDNQFWRFKPELYNSRLLFANSKNGIVLYNGPRALVSCVTFDRNDRVLDVKPYANISNEVGFFFNSVASSEPLLSPSSSLYYPTTSIKLNHVTRTKDDSIYFWANSFDGTGGTFNIINSDLYSSRDTFEHFNNSLFGNPSLLKQENAVLIQGGSGTGETVEFDQTEFYSNLISINSEDNVELHLNEITVNYKNLPGATPVAMPIIPGSKFLKMVGNFSDVSLKPIPKPFRTLVNSKIYNVETGFQINDCKNVKIESFDIDLEYQGSGVSNYTIKTNTNSTGIVYNNFGIQANYIDHSAVTNNTILHAKSGIQLFHTQIDIVNNTILDLNDDTGVPQGCFPGPCYATPSWGIRAVNSQPIITENKVYNNLNNYPTSDPSANTKVVGIELDNSTSWDPTVSCNNIEYTGVAMKFTGDNSGGEILKNKMNDHTVGFLLHQNGVVGNVGSSGNASQNQWTGSYSKSHTFANKSNGGASNLYVQSGAPYNPLITLGDYLGVGASPMVKTITTAGSNSGCTTRARVRNNTANTNAPSFRQFQNGKTVRGKQPFMVYASDSALQFNQQLLFFNLSKDSALMNSTAWKQFSDSMRTTAIGKTIGQPLNNAGRGAINVGTPTNFDTNLELIYPIAVRYKNGIELTKKEMAQLHDMALKCPYYDGLAVYQARSIITALGGTEVYNNCESVELIPSVGNASKRIKSEENSELSSFTIYPNPAKEMIFLNFEVNEKDNVTFELYDVLGKQQTISRLNATNQHQIKLSNVQPGIYFYRLLVNDTASESGKLIIE